MTDAATHDEGTKEEHEESEAPKAKFLTAETESPKTPEQMSDSEFRTAVMESITKLGDSHVQLVKKLNGFIDRWELMRKAGKF